MGSGGDLADFDMIDDLASLEAFSRDLLKEKVVAVDTEADSFYHYFDKTCLVQVGTREKFYLIDPLALGGPAKLAPLGPVFASPDVRVIFHAAEYDIYVLKRDCGFEFANLFDTMVSAQLLGYPSIGLAAMIEHYFGIKLAKDEQRSDWSRRPLSDKQLTYAASDVEFLIPLSENLEAELKEKKRHSWAQEEFATLVQREWPERPFDELGYLRIKGARKLDPESMSVLSHLYLMRDKRARAIDRPPFKVLGNRALLEIAESQPRTLEALADIKGVSDLMIRRMGAELLDAVNAGYGKPHGPIPKPQGNGRKRMDRRTERRVNILKRWRTPRAEQLGIDPGILCPNAGLEAIAWANPQTPDEIDQIPELRGWFRGSFGAEVVAALDSEADDPGDDSSSRRRRRDDEG